MDIYRLVPVKLKCFLRDNAGTTVMEYAVLGALASVVGVLALLAIASK